MAHSFPTRPQSRYMSGSAAVTKTVRASIGDSRPLHALLGLAYLLSYWNVYVGYISVTWAYMGFPYHPMEIWQIAFAALGVMAVAFSLPTRLRAPSAIFLWLLFTFVYVPTMAQTFMVGERAADIYTMPLAAFTGIMIWLCWACRLAPQVTAKPASIQWVSRELLAYGSFLVTITVGAILLVYYRSILTFADITSSQDVYALRFAAADMTGGIIAYVRIYYTYVFGPTVFIFALMSRRYRWFIVPAVACFVISYMIDGSKISLLIPMAMAAAYAVIRWARSSVLFMTGALGALTLVSGLLTGHSSVLRWVADLILVRSIAIPGQQFALYYDLFGTRGYTWWSNVKGISLFVSPPAAFAADPRWPMLGKIVGEEYGGIASQNNSNANLFAGEGVAAAGTFGVIVIGLVLALYLRVLDRSVIGLHRTFVIVLMVPAALALTNIHLSTMLMSFGGAFFVALFFVMTRPARAAGVVP